MSIQVSDNAEAHRYEAVEDGAVLGFAAYQLDGGQITFTHTEVDPSQEGRGIGSTLVRAALDDVRTRGLRVRPLCPFVKAWIERHPDYTDLVG